MQFRFINVLAKLGELHFKIGLHLARRSPFYKLQVLCKFMADLTSANLNMFRGPVLKVCNWPRATTKLLCINFNFAKVANSTDLV